MPASRTASPLRCGINAGFGEPLAHEVAGLREHRYTTVRQDLQFVSNPTTLTMLLRDLRFSDICPLWIMREPQISFAQADELVELCNEPNLNGYTPEQYAALWNRVAPATLARGVTLFAGSISNLDRAGLDWLKRAWRCFSPTPTHVSVHRYPENGGFSEPHKGFKNREQEVDALRQIIGSATLSVTEFGYHTAPRTWRGFWPLRPWTDEQVMSFSMQEWQFWSDMKAESAYIYQLNDSPTNREERYGVRRLEGTWKPVAQSHYFFK